MDQISSKRSVAGLVPWTLVLGLVALSAPRVARAQAEPVQTEPVQTEPVQTPQAGALAPEGKPVVVLLPLQVQGKAVEADRRVIEQRLALGLQHAGLSVIAGERVASAVKPFGASCAADCQSTLASVFRAPYLVVSQLEVVHDNFTLQLSAVRGRNSEEIVALDRHCDICGIAELADTVRATGEDLGQRLLLLATGDPSADDASGARVEIKTKPPGAMVFVDGKPVGTSPRVVNLTAGEHDVSAEAGGYATSRQRWAAKAGASSVLELTLVREHAAHPAWRTIGGWTAFGLGVAAVVAGIVLVAVDGNSTDCAPGENFDQTCQGAMSTAAGGYTAIAAGAAASIGGVWLLLSGKR